METSEPLSEAEEAKLLGFLNLANDDGVGPLSPQVSASAARAGSEPKQLGTPETQGSPGRPTMAPEGESELEDVDPGLGLDEEVGWCSLHEKKRRKLYLQPVGDPEKDQWACIPNFLCKLPKSGRNSKTPTGEGLRLMEDPASALAFGKREIICSVHGKLRSARNMMKISETEWCCIPNYQCRLEKHAAPGLHGGPGRVVNGGMVNPYGLVRNQSSNISIGSHNSIGSDGAGSLDGAFLQPRHHHNLHNGGPQIQMMPQPMPTMQPVYLVAAPGVAGGQPQMGAQTYFVAAGSLGQVPTAQYQPTYVSAGMPQYGQPQVLTGQQPPWQPMQMMHPLSSGSQGYIVISNNNQQYAQPAPTMMANPNINMMPVCYSPTMYPSQPQPVTSTTPPQQMAPSPTQIVLHR